MAEKPQPEIVTFPTTDSKTLGAAAYVADRETEALLRDLLPKWGYGNAQIGRGGIRDAIRDYAKQAMPDVLIVDISGVSLPLSDLQELANICPPRVHVVVLGDRDNVGLYRDLIDIGVTDYLVKPVPSDLLSRAVARASGRLAARSAEPRTGKTVAVYGVRGGAGATTAVFNTGWLLANTFNRHVMLADLNLANGSLALEMGLEPASGLAELLTTPERIDNVVVDRATLEAEEKLKVLASEVELGRDESYEEAAVARLMTHLRSRYHFILQDIDRSRPAVAMSILKKADVRILVMDATLAAVRDCARLLRFLGEADESREVIIVLNRARSRGAGEVPMDRMTRFIGRPIDIVIPFEKKKLAVASLNGAPVVREKAAITDAYIRLAGMLVGQKEGAKRFRSGWFSSLRGR